MMLMWEKRRTEGRKSVKKTGTFVNTKGISKKETEQREG